MTRWEIRGREFGNCNCSYGCPCQFNALPTYGHCRGLAVFEIDEGFHGTTRLDGLRAAGCDVVYEPGLKDEPLAAALGDTRAQVLVVRSTKVTAAKGSARDKFIPSSAVSSRVCARS